FLPLLKALISLGVKVIPDHATHLPLSIIGLDGLEGGEIELDGSESSQFLSALLMIAPFAKSTIDIHFTNLVSNPYVEMTSKIMTDFGVLVKRFHRERIAVPAPQYYRGRSYTIE